MMGMWGIGVVIRDEGGPFFVPSPVCTYLKTHPLEIEENNCANAKKRKKNVLSGARKDPVTDLKSGRKPVPMAFNLKKCGGRINRRNVVMVI